jgi:hypothetical protein
LVGNRFLRNIKIDETFRVVNIQTDW